MPAYRRVAGTEVPGVELVVSPACAMWRTGLLTSGFRRRWAGQYHHGGTEGRGHRVSGWWPGSRLGPQTSFLLIAGQNNAQADHSLGVTPLSRCNEEFTRRAVNSSHIRRDPVGVKSGCPGGRSRAPQGPPETYGRLPLWRVGCGESCGGRTGSDVARTAHGGVPRHKRPNLPPSSHTRRGPACQGELSPVVHSKSA